MVMVSKVKWIMLLTVIFTILLCILAFAYVGSKNLYHTKTPHGTFVIKTLEEGTVADGYLY